MSIRRLSLLLFAVLALNLSAWANHSRTLLFQTEVTLNGSKLPTGFYEISWVSHSPEATVTFVKAGHVMTTAMARWVDRGVKYKANAVVYAISADGSHTLLEIRFAGQSQALAFAPVN